MKEQASTGIELPKESMAVLSTAHIPEVEGKRLSAYIEDGAVVGVDFEHGWSLWAYQDQANLPQEIPHVVNLLRIAREQEVAWLLLDCDADEVESDCLPVFDW